MPPLLLALDFGGTKHAAATLTAGQTTWSTYHRELAPPNADAQTDLQVMRSLIQTVLGDRKPDAIGVSFGGPVAAQTGTVKLSHHVPGWENLPLQTLLTEEFGVPVRVDNDANVAALGEYRFGAGQHCSSLCYITISTGVGGGWILNDRLWQGMSGMAGEIGHTVVDPNGPLCLCGKRGCVERLASGPYLAHDMQAQLRQHPDQGEILRELVAGELDQITAQHISQAAAQGDALAREYLERAGWAIGIGIGNAANLINPQCFILGGGVTQAGAIFWDTVRQVARNTALPEVDLEIVPAQLGDTAPLWGAIALAETLVDRVQ